MADPYKKAAVTPNRRSDAVTSLTDNSGGTADNTVAAVSGSGADAAINNNFADLAAKVNTLIEALEKAGFINPS